MTRRFLKKRSKKSGLPPGTLVYIRKEKIGKVTITIIGYDEAGFQEKEVETIEESLHFKAKRSRMHGLCYHAHHWRNNVDLLPKEEIAVASPDHV